MPQLLLQGFPDGAIRIGSTLSVLKKDGRVTYFVGGDNYFSHAERDEAGLRFVTATLIANRHVRASEVEASCLAVPCRTLMNWTRQLTENCEHRSKAGCKPPVKSWMVREVPDPSSFSGGGLYLHAVDPLMTTVSA